LSKPSSTTSGSQVNRRSGTGRQDSFADEDTTEEEARAEYQRLAERRVRLGLVLAEIGEKAGVRSPTTSCSAASSSRSAAFRQSQQQQVFDFYRQNPQALANIRAPLFEEKVVDHLMTQIAVTDKAVSREELLADDAEPAGEAEEAKPAKKKAAPKKKKADAEE
jgi:trigger factor